MFRQIMFFAALLALFSCQSGTRWEEKYVDKKPSQLDTFAVINARQEIPENAQPIGELWFEAKYSVWFENVSSLELICSEYGGNLVQITDVDYSKRSPLLYAKVYSSDISSIREIKAFEGECENEISLVSTFSNRVIIQIKDQNYRRFGDSVLVVCPDKQAKLIQLRLTVVDSVDLLVAVEDIIEYPAFIKFYQERKIPLSASNSSGIGVSYNPRRGFGFGIRIPTGGGNSQPSDSLGYRNFITSSESRGPLVTAEHIDYEIVDMSPDNLEYYYLMSRPRMK